MSIEPSAPAFALTAAEVRNLLEDTTPATRIDMTHKIGDAYSRQLLGDKENRIAEQIFRLLVRDTEVRVRAALAQHVKDSDRIPRDIIMPLARDVEEVSLPVLQYSEVLTDHDLVEIIEATKEVSRRLAISKRRDVSDVVTGRLLEENNDEIVAALVSNAGARISEKDMGRIVDAHGHNGAVMQALAARPHLPVAVTEKLVHVVSASLGETLRQKYKLPAEQIEPEVEKVRESETLRLVRKAQSQQDIEQLIVQLIAFNRLTPSLILSALCQGDFAFFEASLAKLSNIPVANARALITDRGELGFRAIYNKSGLPDTMFPAVKLLLKVVRELDGEGEKPGHSRYANRIVERILKYAEGEHIENLSYIIALVRRAGQ
ncbi:MAG: DUF2336 domain-containing protein [Pseudomonadota bacterium]|nr:DUF2336 domain-containing protein [Pseudomonadota bacterium]